MRYEGVLVLCSIMMATPQVACVGGRRQVRAAEPAKRKPPRTRLTPRATASYVPRMPRALPASAARSGSEAFVLGAARPRVAGLRWWCWSCTEAGPNDG